MVVGLPQQADRYSFTGHESFPLRFAWLPKGVREATFNPDLFTREEAPTVLGVGKNMVASIRHWCLATAIMNLRDGKSGLVKVSDLGQALFAQDGWDPFLEDIGTLWLLHWNLVRRVERASTWHLAFTRWTAPAFTRDQLVSWLLEYVRTSPTTRATPASLRRDVDVFVRSYTPTHPTRDLSLEDTFDCPLIELGLIREVEPRLFAFTHGSRPSLPAEIFVFALLDHWQSRYAGQRSLSFESIHAGPGSLGGAFKLSETALAERLETLPTWTGLSYDETAGTRMVLRTEPIGQGWQCEPMDALRQYYGELTSTGVLQEALWRGATGD